MNRALASSAKPNTHDRIFYTQGDDYVSSKLEALRIAAYYVETERIRDGKRIALKGQFNSAQRQRPG